MPGHLNFKFTSLILLFLLKYKVKIQRSNTETVLQDTVDRLMETGRCYGIEINMEKN